MGGRAVKLLDRIVHLFRREKKYRYTNQYLCPNHQQILWEYSSSLIENRPCEKCGSETEPFGYTDNSDGSYVILNRAVYDRVNQEQKGEGNGVPKLTVRAIPVLKTKPPAKTPPSA